MLIKHNANEKLSYIKKIFEVESEKEIFLARNFASGIAPFSGFTSPFRIASIVKKHFPDH